MNQKQLTQLVKKLQRTVRSQSPGRKNFYFNRKGKLGKGFQPKYSGQSIAEIMKKTYGKRRA